jgi:hypothetical protein
MVYVFVFFFRIHRMILVSIPVFVFVLPCPFCCHCHCLSMSYRILPLPCLIGTNGSANNFFSCCTNSVFVFAMPVLLSLPLSLSLPTPITLYCTRFEARLLDAFHVHHQKAQIMTVMRSFANWRLMVVLEKSNNTFKEVVISSHHNFAFVF